MSVKAFTAKRKIERNGFYLKKIFRQDLKDNQDFFFIPGFRLPAIASRSGETGGDETGNIQFASRKI
jgi:hypothetical protein